MPFLWVFSYINPSSISFASEKAGGARKLVPDARLYFACEVVIVCSCGDGGLWVGALDMIDAELLKVPINHAP